MLQTKARIFLNEKRVGLKTGTHRMLDCFNHTGNADSSMLPFSDLIAIRDETLAASETVQHEMPSAGIVVLIPIVGFISVEVLGSEEKLLRPGEVLIRRFEAGAVFSFRNPYVDETINYLQLWFNKPVSITDQLEEIASFNLDDKPETLIDLLPAECSSIPGYITIGKYSGRSELCYKKRIENSVVFAFVVEGVFELENRLLHQRDGLAIWDTEVIEAEALSSSGILMVLELLES